LVPEERLLLFLVHHVCLRDRVELLEFKFLISVLALVFVSPVDMTFPNAFCVANGYKLYEFIL